MPDCAVNQGYTKTCRDSIGGIKAVYFTELANKLLITSASGNITGFTLAPGKKFYKYELEQATGTANETPKPNAANGSFYVEETLNIKVPKRLASFSYHLRNLAVQDLMGIIEGMDGTLWLFGENNGLKMQDSQAPFGVAMADMSGYDLNWLAMENDMAKTVAPGLLASLIVAA